MNRHDDHFSPDHIDEQIEQHVWESSPAPLQSGPAQDLLRALHVLYEEEKKEDAYTLDRAWSRIAAADDQQQGNHSQKNMRLIRMKEPGSFSPRQSDRPLRRPLMQRFGALVAAVCLIILVGGAVFMFSAMTAGKNTHTGSGGQPLTPTPIPATPHPLTPTPAAPITPTPQPLTPTPATPITPTPHPITPTPAPSISPTPPPMTPTPPPTPTPTVGGN